MKSVCKPIAWAVAVLVCGAAAIRADDPDAAKKAIKPFTFRDAKTGIIFYVESDGRHVAAIDRDGKILWHRNPFEEHKLEPYRNARPVTARIGADVSPNNVGQMKKAGQKGPYIWIAFNSTQSFVADQMTGESVFLGQD